MEIKFRVIPISLTQGIIQEIPEDKNTISIAAIYDTQKKAVIIHPEWEPIKDEILKIIISVVDMPIFKAFIGDRFRIDTWDFKFSKAQ